jgi:hypothetical protein
VRAVANVVTILVAEDEAAIRHMLDFACRGRVSP